MARQSYIDQMLSRAELELMRAHIAALSRAYQKIKLLVVTRSDNASQYQKECKILLEWYENSKHRWDTRNHIQMAWQSDLDREAPQAVAAGTGQRWDTCRGGCGRPPS